MDRFIGECDGVLHVLEPIGKYLWEFSFLNEGYESIHSTWKVLDLPYAWWLELPIEAWVCLEKQ